MKADLHFHTTHSDGTASPEAMVSMVRKRGLDAFSITDHDTPGDIKEYERLAKEHGLVYVSGMEVTSEKGHILVYCLPGNAEIFKEFKPFNPIQDYIEKAHACNAVIAPAHPFDYFRHGMGNAVCDYSWTAFETFNGSTVFPFSNRRAQEMAKTLNIPEIGGSDAHTRYYVGLTYTMVEASTAEELLDAIRRGETAVGGAHLNVFQFSHRMLISKIFK